MTPKFIKKLISYKITLFFILFISINACYSYDNSTNTTDSANITFNLTDFDFDGYNFTIDCNDNDSAIHPDAAEIPYDSIDQDCNGADLIDVDFDGYNYSVDCNDNNPDINPGKKEIYYNEIDDDCNPNTSDELSFEITLNKNQYNIGENAEFIIHATNNSDVIVALITPDDYYDYSAQFINQTYPIEESIPHTKLAGTYTIIGILNKEGFNLYTNKTFEIINSIDISIDSDTSILKNETLSLTGSATGGYDNTYSYKWYFGDDNTETGKSIAHKYSDSGNYDITLNVKDSQGNEKNKTIDVKVYELYKLKIITINKDNNKYLAQSQITVNGVTKSTNSFGAVEFLLKKGDYDISIFNDGFELYEDNNYKLRNNKTLSINLSEIDDISPVIKLKNNEINADNGKTEINFEVSDTSTVDCFIYTSKDGNWWNLETKIKDIKNSNPHQAILNISSNESLKYKIECIDSNSNTALSNEGIINVKNTNKELDFPEIEELKKTLNNANDYFEKLNSKQKEVFLLMKMQITNKEAQRFANNFDRDLDSIVNPRCPGIHCNITDEERKKRIDDLVLNTKEAINKVPITIEISSSDEFVKYPSKIEIESALKTYFESKNKIIDKKELKGLVEKNSLLQSKLTVSAKVYNIEIELIGGDNYDITLFNKNLKFHETDNSILNNKDILLIEYINLENIETSEINFITKSESISSHNLFELSKNGKDITYILRKDIDSEKAKAPNTLLLSSYLEPQHFFTGFAALGFNSLKDINYLYIILFFIIIIIFARVLFMFDIPDKIGISKLFLNFKKKEYNSLLMLINDSLDYKESGDMQKASLIYKEIKLRYEELPKSLRLRIYDKIIELCGKLDEGYMENLIDSVNKHIAEKDLLSASKIYNVIENTYKKLSQTSKSLFENDLNNIHLKLSKGK